MYMCGFYKQEAPPAPHRACIVNFAILSIVYVAVPHRACIVNFAILFIVYVAVPNRACIVNWQFFQLRISQNRIAHVS